MYLYFNSALAETASAGYLIDKTSVLPVGRPRTRPPRERHEWHYHLGGVRHCRVPLNADLKEVLEVCILIRIYKYMCVYVCIHVHIHILHPRLGFLILFLR